MAIYVSLAFKKYGDDKLVSFTNTVYQHMSVDDQYKPLKTFVDDIKVKNDAFIASISDAVGGGFKLTELKNACRAVLLKLLERVAHKLEDMASEQNDNPRVITDAAFEVRGAKSKPAKEAVTSLDPPVLTVKNIDNMPGAAKGEWTGMPNAINYALQYRKLSDTVWQNGFHTDAEEFTFTNLESGAVYEFQVRTQGSGGLSSGWATSLPIYVS